MPIVSHRCPSNIALVKYWGKKGNQLPANPSLSFTLSASYTEMEIQYEPTTKPQTTITAKFQFEGKPNPKFKAKIDSFLNSQAKNFPFLRNFKLSIKSSNSFPHSAGIASSASSMAALAMCLCSIEQELSGQPVDKSSLAYSQKASSLARLASGSACRSLFPRLALWGETPLVAGSSDEYAVAVDTIAPIFKTYQNRILIVSSEEKDVSSRAGHALMDTHPFAAARYAQAQDNLKNLLQAMKNGNLELFGQIVENEALTLHALMMNSQPSVLLMHSKTVRLMKRIIEFREKTELPICFTLDAGPNIHLLFPEQISSTIDRWIKEKLIFLCEDNKVIHDQVGFKF